MILPALFGRILQPFTAGNAVPPQALTRTHIYAVDLMRIVVVTGVVAIHIVSQGPPTVFIGAVHMILHVNREIFMMISAFVLTYSYGMRSKVNWGNFFRRRYMLIVIPYATWTVLYTLIGGTTFHSIAQFVGTTTGYLIDGLARYNLYFMLILLQLYLIFPLLRWMMASLNKKQHIILLAVTAAVQVGLLLIIEFSWGNGSPLNFWLASPDPWLISYPFYIVAGMVAAWYYHELLDFVQTNLRFLVGLTLGSMVAGLAIYFVQLQIGMGISSADTTFQPIVMLQSVAVALIVLSLGRRWELGKMRWRGLALRGSETSYGVYLVHPLVIQLLIAGLPVVGLSALIGNSPLAVVGQLVIGVPLIMGLSNALVLLAYRTPFSLPLTGKPRDHEPSVVKPSGALAESS